MKNLVALNEFTAPVPCIQDGTDELKESVFQSMVQALANRTEYAKFEIEKRTKNETTLPGGTNLNTVTTSGFYCLNTGNTNGPSEVDFNQMIVMHGGSDTITQILGNYSTGTLWTRSGNPSDVGGNGVWTAWRALAFTDSPVFTGNPTAPTPAAGDSDTSLATTAFTQQEITTRAVQLTGNQTIAGEKYFSGKVLLPNGSASNPAIAFNSDGIKDTGFFWNTDGNLNVTTNGVERGYFNGNGWVGNADTVDGQHFSWANSDNNPTYLWGANANGQAFLANRSAMSVNYANSAGSVAGFAQSLASSGYQKLPSGLILQWGSIAVNADANVNVTFATTFPNICLHVLSAMLSTATGNDDVFTRTISYNQSGATLRGEAVTSTVAGSRHVQFLAIGY
jgi:hypothetical protein